MTIDQMHDAADAYIERTVVPMAAMMRQAGAGQRGLNAWLLGEAELLIDEAAETSVEPARDFAIVKARALRKIADELQDEAICALAASKTA